MLAYRLQFYKTNLVFFIIDIVYIGVVNHLHMSVAIDAMCAGKHVLCEKPLGVNKNEVKTMIECACKNNVLLMEVYC